MSRPAGATTSATTTATIVDSNGRAKAYRPLPAADRAQALRDGLDAYERGDFFEAHERLEPAWMGSPDPVERAYLQGLIKLAAAYVHGVRGNPAGIRKNLEGARARLREAVDGAGPGTVADRPDAGALLVDIDLRLVDLAAHPDGPTLPAPVLLRSLR